MKDRGQGSGSEIRSVFRLLAYNCDVLIFSIKLSSDVLQIITCLCGRIDFVER